MLLEDAWELRTLQFALKIIARQVNDMKLWNKMRVVPQLMCVLAVGAVIFGPASVNASTVQLGNDIRCSSNNQKNGISVSDVTGNLGGATDCWGTVDGNESQQTGTQTDGSSVLDSVPGRSWRASWRQPDGETPSVPTHPFPLGS